MSVTPVVTSDGSCQAAMDDFRRRLRKLIITAIQKGAHADCVMESLLALADLVSETQAETYVIKNDLFFVRPDDNRLH